MAEFLLEILCDEIPSGLQKSTLDQFIEKFKSEKINIIEGYHGPRRWVLVAEWQNDLSVKIEKLERGPKVGSSEVAVEKFCEKYSINRKQLEIDEIKGSQYYIYRQIFELSEKEFLKESILKVLSSIVFPKQMDWSGNNGQKWIRPIISILALYRKNIDEKFEVIDFEFAGVRSSSFTLGHQIIKNNQKIELSGISNINEYHYELAKNFVIISEEDRRERILAECQKKEGFKKELLEDLLDELVCIAEYPKLLDCSIKEDYLSIPNRLIAYTMILNQRYIPLYIDDHGRKLKSKFLVVIDHDNPNELICAGYERVLNARLDDAKFFWERMQSKTLDELIDQLKTTQSEYNPSLSVYEFNDLLFEVIKSNLPESTITRELLNMISCDLGTEIITEFPALRGILAEEYLIQNNHNFEAEIAYNSYYNETELCDKTRNVLKNESELSRYIVFFKLLLKLKYYLIEKNENPTGSKDPFNLAGAVRTMMEMALGISIKEYIGQSMPLSQNYNQELMKLEVFNSGDKLQKFVISTVMNLMSSFFENITDRKIIEFLLKNKEINSFCDICIQLAEFSTCKILQKETEFLSAYKRVCNINKKYLDISNIKEVSKDLLIAEEEVALYNLFKSALIDKRIDELDFEKISRSINQFFDNVRIEVEDVKLKNNRINSIRSLYSTIEDLFPIERLILNI